MGWIEKIESTLMESRIRRDFTLKPFTTLRIGGPVDCLIELESERDLLSLFKIIDQEHLPWQMIGKGSNLLVPDQGLKGIALRLGKAFQTVERKSEVQVVAGAGCANPSLVEKCRQWGLSGLEFLIAVPGTIGGAVAMNAGAHGGETAGVIASVRYLHIGHGIESAEREQFRFDYRSSELKGEKGKIVLAGAFQLKPSSPEDIGKTMDEIKRYRRETQPRDFPNCGSVFKNPPGHFAARLIEECGLKGKMIGGAQISEKHANFIVNRKDATARDVLALIDLAREMVHQASGISLELELQVLN